MEEKILPQSSADVFVSANHWVYENQGFKKNHEFFVLPFLGPTPVQVLEKGGDCSDKSRLLMAMLEAVGIDSSLVMLYSADGVTSTHTIVEVRDKKYTAIADPVFDVVFPKGDNGYYRMQELRQSPALLLSRLDELVQLRGVDNKIALYKRNSETYQFATTVNWNKNALMKFIAGRLEKLGIEPNTVRRPHFLDDPKFFITLGLSAMAVFFATLAGILKVWAYRAAKDKDKVAV